jgi:hypothetical protein
MKLQLEEGLPHPLAAGTPEEYSIIGNSAKPNNTRLTLK